MTDELSVALLVDGRSIDEWQRRTLDHLLADTNAEIGAVLVNAGNDAGITSSTLRDHASLWTAYAATRRASWRLRGQPWYRRRRSIPGFENATVREVEPLESAGLGKELPDRAVDELGRHDITVRFGFGILRGEALTVSECGVLSFHHGDLREYRGRPAGFWELLEGRDDVGITVQQLSDTLDGGRIVAFDTVDIRGVPSWPSVLDRLFRASEPLLGEAVQSLQQGDGGTEPDRLGDLYTEPDWRATLRYLALRSRRSLGP